MRRSLPMLLGGLLLLVLAIPVALLGHAALTEQASDMRDLTSLPRNFVAAKPQRSLSQRAAGKLVGSDGVERFADVVRTYRIMTFVPGAEVPPDTLVTMAEDIDRLPTAQMRAQGLVLLGSLFQRTSGAAGGVTVNKSLRDESFQLFREALRQFRNAALEDPQNEEAKFDLELLLRQQTATRPKSVRNNQKASQKRTIRRRAPSRRPQLNRTETHHAGVYVAGTGY